MNLDLRDAGRLLEGACSRHSEIGVPMCIADAAGNLVALERMEGGKIVSVTIAIDKAYTEAAAKNATHEYGIAGQPGAPAYGVNSAIGGRLMVVGGGLPVIVSGEVVGAEGVSSGTPAQDRDVADAALNHLERT